MDQGKKDEFAKELSDLCEKYELKGCCFGAETNDNMLIGLHCIDRAGRGHTYKDMAMSAFSASRLYQSAREKLLTYMNEK